jgi:hypothetical protein
MQEKKARFEQVPIELALNALRLPDGRPKNIANGSHLPRNRTRIRAGSRLLRRRRPFASVPKNTSRLT